MNYPPPPPLPPKPGNHLPGTTYPDWLCDELDNGDHEEEQAHVQQQANNISVAETYLNRVPSLFVIAMLGAWSDKHGAKHLMR